MLAVTLGLAFLFAVFGSVLLHELGHALVARRYGMRTHSIVLTPIGGIANLDGMPAAPRAELAIALAGPAVNVVIAAGLALVSAMGFGLGFGLFSALMWANVTLAVFNLIPAFPMDGGRALRALLATRMGKRAATGIAVNLGKAVAIAMGIIGFFTSPMLMMIAVFVWFAGSAEARAVGYDAARRGVPGSGPRPPPTRARAQRGGTIPMPATTRSKWSTDATSRRDRAGPRASCSSTVGSTIADRPGADRPGADRARR